MRVVLGEFGGRLRVTFLTSGQEMGRMSPGLGIPAGKDVVIAMAVRAPGAAGVAQNIHLPVKGIPEGFQALLVADPALLGHAQLPFVRIHPPDFVGSVTIGAGRSLEVAPPHPFSMDAFFITFLHAGVALPAGAGNIMPVGGRGGVQMASYFVRSMAAGADRRHQ